MQTIRCVLLLSCWLLSAVAWAQTVPATADSLSSPPANSLSTPSGIRYVVLRPGTGPQAVAGSRAAVYYRGFLPNGKLFDQTLFPNKPLRVRAGRGDVIKGWDELLLLLPVGSRVQAWIPARLAYGAKGVRSPADEDRYLIPPDTDLRFEMEIMPLK
ncbi:FKBP-type peptidyl-prolyl cis-trans isomerase [Hymenobacter sediminicola]|uniref:Peptidyl-prolyl cis-trans isomerase n=1 Tax=Hymenobacter sediminicola TaxID=2761579 RepID=A0A7G7W5V9_9BACT|nr:FKBP-type peptidyl-prolyl cis-trans isomerase [Hymenobacter sediminicola]QNH61752.1 FKBP-type peptidyl-prolyl cis-trans isomerase [Hymenobacter sediminicola]